MGQGYGKYSTYLLVFHLHNFKVFVIESKMAEIKRKGTYCLIRFILIEKWIRLVFLLALRRRGGVGGGGRRSWGGE